MEGRNFPGDKPGAAGKGAGAGEDGTERDASKNKGPRDGKIFMGSLGSISFSFCSFILAINVYKSL